VFPRFCLLFVALVCVRVLHASDVAFSVSESKNNQPVADAVISLTHLDAAAKPAVAESAPKIEIVQRDKSFSPYVTPLRVGTTVHFPNRDKIKHHVYSISPAKNFELPLYAGEAREPIVFDRPGVVAVGCNIHDSMIAYIVVLDTPWFAKTGADGKVIIAGVPAGRYRAEVWQPRLKPGLLVNREMTVADTAAAPIVFALELEKDNRKKSMLDMKGGGYK
jgi:plastocyanin